MVSIYTDMVSAILSSPALDHHFSNLKFLNNSFISGNRWNRYKKYLLGSFIKYSREKGWYFFDCVNVCVCVMLACASACACVSKLIFCTLTQLDDVYENAHKNLTEISMEKQH